MDVWSDQEGEDALYLEAGTEEGGGKGGIAGLAHAQQHCDSDDSNAESHYANSYPDDEVRGDLLGPPWIKYLNLLGSLAALRQCN